MYNWAAGKIFGRLIGAKLLKLSTLPFLDVMLPSSKALIPPYLQTPTRLNSVTCQGTSLYSQEPPVLEGLYR